jgi:superfamily II DNA or RNA helicase
VKVGTWVWATEFQQLCQVIEAQHLWDNTFYRVWLPNQDAVVRVRSDQLRPLAEADTFSPAKVTYVAAAARIADALTQNVLLAPIESQVIPLPHQIKALSKAVSGDRIRYLLADEVGLGKTIEAGLIIRELKLRGLVRRVLVVAPKGLVTQWVSEMQTHFNESFQLVLPEDLKTLRRFCNSDQESVPKAQFAQASIPNPWRLFNQVVCPMDSVKPLDKRRGWSAEQVALFNRDRFEDLIAASWDLVVIDEAHRLGGSTDQVARYRLGQALAETAPYLLLLSATPHQGKTDAFCRLISLLDPMAFPDVGSINRDQVQNYVIRTEKRKAIDAHEKPLFKPRHTQLVPISWASRHQEQRQLYEAVTDYVREGYNQALKQKKSYIGFLMILMQRLVTSSTRAIRTTLERRLEAILDSDTQLTLFSTSEEEWSDMDGQEQIDILLAHQLKAWKSEKVEVELLLDIARRTEASAPDAKAEALLEWFYRLQQEESNPDLKVLIFTEFVPTQEMLVEFLGDRGIPVVCLNGSMGLEERKQAQAAFAKDSQILISTDAGGEGLNLQFCHVIVNYDMPWNPMRLEQRIGRVDRIGQTHLVRAMNFVLEGTVEYRVRDVLEQKLDLILKEFGVDKTGDVLDSAQAANLFDDLYIEALLAPEQLGSKMESVLDVLKGQAQVVQQNAEIYTSDEVLAPTEAQNLANHPISYWVERMTIAYLHSHGGQVQKVNKGWNLTWQDGKQRENAVFTAVEATAYPEAHYLTLEDTQIRGLVMGLPRFAEGQPVPCLRLADLPENVQGFWSLWRITLKTEDSHYQRILTIFRHDNGKTFLPTARHVWEQLLLVDQPIQSYLTGKLAVDAFQQSWEVAVSQGKNAYDELLKKHHQQLELEQKKGDYTFATRRQLLQRIGLTAVREHRLSQLEREKYQWQAQLQQKALIHPDLTALILVRIEGKML